MARISEPFQTKIIDKIYALANDPYYNAKKLIGRKAYRIRIGNYRVLYEINNNTLLVLVISCFDNIKNLFNIFVSKSFCNSI